MKNKKMTEHGGETTMLMIDTFLKAVHVGGKIFKGILWMLKKLSIMPTTMH